ncbi:DUF262 domain-containing protein [Undibacterium sp.]|uniref:DUF262 domain-containing protein n=1 Tax=Undibacterium sp. TaxID=1914977 RepID=UPI0025F88859|nr:DUF262 domain-containing protein [Undibacterium sp.]
MQKKDPKPEIMRLEELAVLVKSGDIKLPRFQRPFVWQRPDMLKLLDSIYKGYPIGSILIWNSSQQLTSERSIAGFDVNIEERSLFPTNYLLDGQQRLTTLCGALFWNGIDDNSIWNIHFDLEREEFVHPKDSNLVQLFPLNKLIDTSDFIRQCMKYGHKIDSEKYVHIAERLLRSIKDYKIAVVKIGDMTIDEVAPIFERINSTGRKLTMVDLMMAATWSEEFDLTHELQNIRLSFIEQGFEDVSDSIILRSISAAAGFGINKDDIQRLRTKSPAELIDAVKEVKRAFNESINFLKNSIYIGDFNYIPYGLQLTYLVEYFRLSKPNNIEQLEHLKQWFWFTSASQYFGRANTGQNSADLAKIRAFAFGKTERLFVVSQLDISNLLFDRFNLRNASSTTFTLLLNSTNPKCTVDERPIDGGHLKMKSSKFFASCLDKYAAYSDRNLARIIYPYTDWNPSDKNFTTPNIDEHLLNQNCIEALISGDSTRFCSIRANLIKAKVGELTGCDISYSIPTGANEDLWCEEIDLS